MRHILAPALLASALLAAPAVAQQSTDPGVSAKIQQDQLTTVTDAFRITARQGDSNARLYPHGGPSDSAILRIGRCIVAGAPGDASAFASGKRPTAALRSTFESCNYGLHGAYADRLATRRIAVKIALAAPPGAR